MGLSMDTRGPFAQLVFHTWLEPLIPSPPPHCEVFRF